MAEEEGTDDGRKTVEASAVEEGRKNVEALTSADGEVKDLVDSVEWLLSLDLEHEQKSTLSEAPPCCSNKQCAQKNGPQPGSGNCSRCGGAWYCSRGCQVQNWKLHKIICSRTKSFVEGNWEKDDQAQKATVVRLLRKIRLYALPFACAHETVGPGLLLLQTSNSFNDFALLEATVNPRSKQKFERAVLLNFFSLGDFKDSVVKDNSELVSVAAALELALDDLNHDSHVLAMCKFRGGRIELLKMPWVPDRSVCRALASDYLGKECIQLNLEDE